MCFSNHVCQGDPLSQLNRRDPSPLQASQSLAHAVIGGSLGSGNGPEAAPQLPPRRRLRRHRCIPLLLKALPLLCAMGDKGGTGHHDVSMHRLYSMI